MTGLGRVSVMLALVGGMQGAFAQGLAGGDPSAVQQASAPVAAIPVIDSQAQTSVQPQAGETTGPSTVDDLQRQIQAHSLTEMRTSYNGSYGASLLFNVKDGAYFVALFQQKAFWRVIKTYDETRAEAIYRDFSHQAERLAVNELRAAKLESQKAQMDKQIEVTQDRARRLQADISIARQQQAAVADRQKSVRSETAALQAQQAQLQSQLRALQQQVRSLQREADAGLPTTAR
ncbi:putative exported protein [Burkholderia cenocepacia J2315]|nr:putative exported protein [Burkholderia cenocepacia J2315]